VHLDFYDVFFNCFGLVGGINSLKIIENHYKFGFPLFLGWSHYFPCWGALYGIEYYMDWQQWHKDDDAIDYTEQTKKDIRWSVNNRLSLKWQFFDKTWQTEFDKTRDEEGNEKYASW